MRIVIDGQKLPTNLRTTKDLLVMVKSLARTLNWRTLYDPGKEVIYVSTIKSTLPLNELELQAPVIDELESVRLQDKVICLDAGHGGKDPGAIGPSKTQEKDNTLAITLLLKEKLENNGATVVLTRYPEDERSIHEDPEDLKERIARINDSGADILISIHNDSFSSATASGTTTFHYGNEPSITLAQYIQKALIKELGTKDRSIRFASFYLLRYAQIPAVLVETAFISNPEEEVLLASSDGRHKIAESIYNGIVHYFKI